MFKQLVLWVAVDSDSQLHYGISKHKTYHPAELTLCEARSIMTTQKQRRTAQQWLKQCVTLLKNHSLSQSCAQLTALSDPLAKSLTGHLHRLVKEGLCLSDLLKEFPELFPHTLYGWVLIGEQCGSLNKLTLKGLDILRKEQENKKRLQKQCLYPITLLSACIVMFICLIKWMLPTVIGLYTSLNQTPPKLINNLYVLNKHLASYCIASSLMIISFITASKKGMLNRTYSYFSLYRQHILAHYLSCLAHMLQAKLPLALSITQASLSLPLSWQKESALVFKQLESGKMLADALSSFPGITDNIRDSIRIGELSESLAMTLDELSNDIRGFLNERWKKAIKLTQPILMGVIALIIGGLFYVMYEPILHITIQ